MQPIQINAFQLLMCQSKDKSHLPSTIEAREHRQLIATEQLHNWVVEYMKSTGAGFTRDTVNTVGNRVVRTLWYIDTAHQQFEERAVHLADSFKAFQGFNEFGKPSQE